MLKTSSAFVTYGDACGCKPIIVESSGYGVHSTASVMMGLFFSNRYHSIGSPSQAFGWPYVGFGWKAIPFKDSHSSDLVIVLKRKRKSFHLTR